MNAIEVIRTGLADFHNELRGDLVDLDPQLLFWQPNAEANHIGFLLWHVVRDEDSVVSWTSKQKEVWEEGDWAARLPIDGDSTRSTLTGPEASALRYDLSTLLRYAETVWASTHERLAAMVDDDLDSQAWPEWTVARHLVEGCVGHSWMHFGEIRYIRGLRGWRFRE